MIASRVGVDPAGAEVLARELQVAEREMRELAAAVRAALADAGVASFAGAEVDVIAGWCGEQARDIRRRAEAVADPGLDRSRPVGLAPWTADAAELKRDELFALLDLAAPRPLAQASLSASYPQLAERRGRAHRELAALGRARTEVSVDAYIHGPGRGDADTADRMSRIERLERLWRRRARATPTEMRAFVAGLDDAEVRHVAAALLEALATRRGGNHNAELDQVLAPLRSRLRDQLAQAARAAYMGQRPRQNGGVDIAALAKLHQDLSFEPRRSTNAFTEFVAGLFLGDFGRASEKGPDASMARSIGHLASGLFAVGDVRDTVANIGAFRWRDAALSALGAIPVAGDLAKAGDTLGDSTKAARRAEDAAAGAQRGADDLAAALKGTPLENWVAGQPLPNAADAVIDPRKFHSYSMDKAHVDNNGKYEAFGKVGYDVETGEGRAAAAADVGAQVRAHLATYPPGREPTRTPHGARATIDVPLRGPNGMTGTLVTRWQYDTGSDIPKLITNYLKVHR